jgi:glutamyl-tRNA synthetase
MNKETIRVRFAPSPSGNLHLGSARTALINFLYARHCHGKFILRLEDTDLARSDIAYSNAILQMLEWLGISWDEGPYFQSQRYDLYQEFKNKLIENGRAYPCFCSREELDKQKEHQIQQGLDTVYNGNCRNIPLTEAKQLMTSGIQYSLRLKLPNTSMIKFNDLIKGELAFKAEGIGDFIIFRQDNTPTYHFAVVIDDALMNISHVIRGEDHLSNTPKQIALYEALAFSIPKFAHLPLILGPDKAKLSKRHGETSIEEFRDKGILPRTLMVYLFHLGYPVASSKDLPSTEEMIEQFDLSRVSSSPSIFDLQKLSWINRKIIQECSSNELYKLIQASISNSELSQEKILRIITLSKHQVNSIHDFHDLLLPFYQYSFQNLNPSDQSNLITEENMVFLSDFFKKLFSTVNPDINYLEKIFELVLSKHQLSKKDAVRIIRFCATGRLISPSLFETLDILGLDELKHRYELFIKEWA